jgi:tripartite-type tricarboxylate transporter receptor subunit TctC
MKTLLAALLCLTASLAGAQVAYPTKTVRIVVCFPAGGTLDRLTRVVAPKLSEAWGQSVIVENKPGGGTVIGTDYVAKSAGDGHTLLMMANSFVINQTLRAGKLPYDSDKDFRPVTQWSSTPNVLVVGGAQPFGSFQELLDAARAKPGQLSFASIGAGTPQHLVGEQLKQSAKVDLIHVPYQGGAQIVMALLGGQVTMAFINYSEVQGHIAGGRMKQLATPGIDSTSWFGMVAPSGTPAPVVAKIQAEIVKALQAPDVIANYKSQGLTPVGDTPEQFGAFMRRERDHYAAIIRAGNIQVD